MLFSSIPFLYYFLPCVILLYLIAPRFLKNTVLLLSSLVFYAWGEPKYVIWMILSIILGYVFGLLIEKYRKKGNHRLAKLFMILSVTSSLAVLGYFKYADFFISNINAVTGRSIPLLKIALPVGISFYTFQILSYTVDVYRGDVAAQKNPIDLATYVALFPQLIAGPIVRYSDIAEQLRNRNHSFEKISAGMSRFIIGLSKKILIANFLGELCDTFKASGDKSVLFFWLYAIAYTLHIYFDFSGYSDMAIGLGKIFGFDFLENFNYPYISGSVTEFWRRWHMSLSSWFKEYVYIPLGGNRKGLTRQLVNISIVWALTGLWHGASWNFVVWGVYYGIILIIEKLGLLKLLKKCPAAIGHIYSLIIIVTGWVIFAVDDLGQAVHYIGMMLGSSGVFAGDDFMYYFGTRVWLLIACAIGSTPLPKMVCDAALKKLGKKEALSGVLETLLMIGIMVLSMAFLVSGSYNPFLYFRF